MLAPERAPDRQLVEAIVAAAAEAGALARSLSGPGLKSWDKVPGHPVCDADLAVDTLLKARLAAIDPGAGWLSEETVDNTDRLAAARLWVVDPIDGTRDYLRGRDGWCVSIALIEDGVPIVGVLDAPARGQVWIATRGSGATCNSVALTTSLRATLPGSRVPADTLPKVDADLVTVPRPNSIALRIAMVASGEADLCASLRWSHEWDIAAAVLVAAEAGAIVTDPLGRPFGFNSKAGEAFGVLASAPAIHAAAVERIAERARAAARR